MYGNVPVVATKSGRSLAAGPVRAQETFRFGLAMPLSGSQALYGADQVKAAEWAVAGAGVATMAAHGRRADLVTLSIHRAGDAPFGRCVPVTVDVTTP